MDFEIDMTYTEEQESFRRDVRAWLEAQAPKTDDERERIVGMGRGNTPWTRMLGEKGWFVPTAPKQLGGGGLTQHHAVVINEELGRLNLPGGIPGILAPAIIVHGTEEQKRRFVVPWYQGKLNVWQVFTEPEAGSDLASLRTRGVREGDEWVINGSKQFISGAGQADWLYTLVNTNPEAPRHENISLFMIKPNLPGITIQRMDLIGEQEYGGGQHFIFFDNVRVSADCLIGQEGKGWAIANTALELEHGGTGRIGGETGGIWDRWSLIPRVMDYLRTGKEEQELPRR